MMDLKDFVYRASKGDHVAFTELVKQHQNMSLGYAYSLLGDFQRAQDVVQESFIIAFQKLDQLKQPDKFPSCM